MNFTNKLCNSERIKILENFLNLPYEEKIRIIETKCAFTNSEYIKCQYPKAERCADCYEKLIEERLNGTTKLY